MAFEVRAADVEKLRTGLRVGRELFSAPVLHFLLACGSMWAGPRCGAAWMGLPMFGIRKKDSGSAVAAGLLPGIILWVVCWLFPDHPHRPMLLQLLPWLIPLVVVVNLANVILEHYDKRSGSGS